MTETPTRVCASCGIAKPWTDFTARQKTCIACIQAKRARTQERKEQITYTPALGEKIADALASGSTVADVTAQAAMPTPRQLRAWRRGNPEFDHACQEAEHASAAAHIDAAKAIVRQMEDGKVPASDGNHIFNAHMKLAATLNPRRYGSNPTIDITSAGRPIVDLEAVLAAAFAALPALPQPEPLDVEAAIVPPKERLQ